MEARQRQSQLEKNNTEQQQKLLEERMKAAEQAQKARNMMRVSAFGIAIYLLRATGRARSLKIDWYSRSEQLPGTSVSDVDLFMSRTLM